MGFGTGGWCHLNTGTAPAKKEGNLSQNRESKPKFTKISVPWGPRSQDHSLRSSLTGKNSSLISLFSRFVGFLFLKDTFSGKYPMYFLLFCFIFLIFSPCSSQEATPGSGDCCHHPRCLAGAGLPALPL